MINYTKKLTNIISELHEGTKLIHKTKQNKKMYCKNTTKKKKKKKRKKK